MDSLIANIAGKHGLARENLATEVLVYILESSDLSVVQGLLASYGVAGEWKSYGYRFEPQRRVVNGRSIPDVQIRDANGERHAVIESKFTAGLTRKQPVDYLTVLPTRGVLLFIVPERRKFQLFEELLNRCRSSQCFEHVAVSESLLTCALIDEKRMEVTSWGELLDRLTDLQRSSQQPPEIQRMKLSDIEQLRRFCDMADKETFEPLTAEQIRGTGISTVIHQLKWATSELITRSIAQGVVQEMSRATRKGAQNALRADEDKSLYYGQNLRFCGMNVWIGFWGEAWEERKLSPLWIEINREEPLANAVVRQIQKVKGESAVIRTPEGHWLIPIPIKEGRYQEDMVEDAVRSLKDLRNLADKTTAQRER
jgi:hypothetical protein